MKKFIGCLLAFVMLVGFASPSFAQVDKVGVLQQKDIVVGRDGGDLKLDATLTRAEFMKLLVHASGMEGVAEKKEYNRLGFTDVSKAHWAYKYIELMKDLGVAAGYPDGRFKPDAPISYQEVIAFAVRLDRDFKDTNRVEGKNWASPYIDYAKKTGLLEGIAVTDFTKQSIRRDIFDLIYNGLPVLETRNVLRDKLALLEKKAEEKPNSGKSGDSSGVTPTPTPNSKPKPTPNPEDKYVNIPDPLFLKVINKNLDPNRPDDQKVTKEEMESLTTISHWLDDEGKPGIKDDAKKSILGTPRSLEGTPEYKFSVSYGIKSIEGIQYAKNLTQLKLNENEISDITPLKDLKKLEYLEFSRNRVVDVTPLKDLTNLTFLKLYNNWIEDVTPLAGLVNLEGLDLHNNVRQKMVDGKRINSGGISDISSLKNLTKLNFLDLSANNLKDVSVIKNFDKIKDIDLSGNHIETYVGLGESIAKRFVAVDNGIGSQNFWAQSVTKEEPIPVTASKVEFDNPYKGFKELFTSLVKATAEGEVSDEEVLQGAQMYTMIESKTDGVEAAYDLESNKIALTVSDAFREANKGKTVDVNMTITYAYTYKWNLNVKLKID